MSLTVEEIINTSNIIFSQYPNINENVYLKYGLMTDSQLLIKVPELNIYPNLTRIEKLLYILIDDIPNKPKESKGLKRYSTLLYLNSLTQELLILLYGSTLSYIEATNSDNNEEEDIHPLEDFILQYDQLLTDNSRILTLGERIGLGVYQGYEEFDGSIQNDTYTYDCAMQFYDRMKEVIIYIIMYSIDPSIINTIINMNPGDSLPDRDFKTEKFKVAADKPLFKYSSRLIDYFK